MTSASRGPSARCAGQGARRLLAHGHRLVPETLQHSRILPGRKVTIEFDGVYQLSEVWINGQYLGKRPYGYIGFSYDLTPHLKFGGDNVIAVKADNSHQPNCRWYSGSGIYRHTWLLVTNQVHVATGARSSPRPRWTWIPPPSKSRPGFRTKATSAAECRLTSTILDRDGNPAEGAQASETQEHRGQRRIRVRAADTSGPAELVVAGQSLSLQGAQLGDGTGPRGRRLVRHGFWDSAGSSSTWTGDSC